MLQTLNTPTDASPRLTKPRDEAQKFLMNQIKIGQAIRSQRIDYLEDLEEARAEKQEWVSRTTELLKQLFTDASVAEQCNDWLGSILPEYAEWALFVEQFDKEMKHRIGRLGELYNSLEEIKEPATVRAKIEPGAAELKAQIMQPPVVEPKPCPRPTPVILLIPRGFDEPSRGPIREFLASLALSAKEIEISMEPNNAWQLPLARDLKTAGVEIDLNRLI